jgi:hypothetical protein
MKTNTLHAVQVLLLLLMFANQHMLDFRFFLAFLQVIGRLNFIPSFTPLWIVCVRIRERLS